MCQSINDKERNVVNGLGTLSFVDKLTFDYKKTISDYKNKIMEASRKKAVSSKFYSMNSDRAGSL